MARLVPLWWLALGLVVAAGTACGDGSEDCKTGAESCTCFPNDTCHSGLECLSDRCVDISGLDGAGGETGDCADDEKLCDGECVSTEDPAYGCARSTCTACVIPDAVATCDTFGQCAIAQCDARRGDCNAVPTDGCETNLNEDIEHCGQCDNQCPHLHSATVFCGGANCLILTCDAGWGDCNDRDDDGCETDVLESAEHCGACGAVCAAGEQCQDGACL